MKTIEAVYENGVFRPLGPVELPEHSRVQFEPRPLDRQDEEPRKAAARAATYRILGQRYDSGETDVAARHNEHQP